MFSRNNGKYGDMKFNPVQTNQRPAREKLAQRIWELIRPVVFLPTPWFARKWRMSWLKFASRWYHGAPRISSKAAVARLSRVDYPWNLSIGEDSSIADNAWVYCLDKITIGARCCIGEDVKLITGSHDVHAPTFDLVTKPITIDNNVWIATGSSVLPGVTIGEGAVIAASSVVVKDVEPWTVVGGNPAKFIKKRDLRDN